MTDLTSKLETEARRVRSRQRRSWTPLVLTLLPFAAALGVLLVLGGQVQQKRRELTDKSEALRAATADLAAVQEQIGGARDDLTKVRADLDEANVQLAVAQTKVAQAAALLADPTLGNDQQRIAEANQVLVKGTTLGRAQELWKKGYDAYRRNDLAAAEQAYLASKAADPKYAPAYNSLGNLKYDEREYDAAAVWYRQALSLRPSYAPAHYNLALVYDKLGRPTEALGCLDEALRARSRYPEALSLKKAIESRERRTPKSG